MIGDVKREDLLGAWELVSFVSVDRDGNETYPYGEGARGIILYTDDGYMSAQIMNPDRAGISGYLTYTGAYRFDAATDTVFHDAEVALWHSWRGTTQVRSARMVDGDLYLSSADGGVLHWRRHARP